MWPKRSFLVDAQVVLRRGANAKRMGWSVPSYAVVGLNVKPGISFAVTIEDHYRLVMVR
jgi:hypothetical protein